MRALSKRLVAGMAEHDWNQSELARATGLGRDSISTYVTEKALPTRQALAKLAKSLGTTPEELLPEMFAPDNGGGETLKLLEAPDQPGKVWIIVNALLPKADAADIGAILFRSGAL